MNQSANRAVRAKKIHRQTHKQKYCSLKLLNMKISLTSTIKSFKLKLQVELK